MEDQENKPLKRLAIEVDAEFHTEIKKRAAERQISLRMWVVRAIMEAIRREKQYE